MFKREASSENYGPGVNLDIITKTQFILIGYWSYTYLWLSTYLKAHLISDFIFVSETKQG